MNHLDTEKTERYRKQLLAAVFARYAWIALSIALIQWFSIPFARYITFEYIRNYSPLGPIEPMISQG